MSPIVQQSITSLLKKIDSLAKAGEPVDALKYVNACATNKIISTYPCLTIHVHVSMYFSVYI